LFFSFLSLFRANHLTNMGWLVSDFFEKYKYSKEVL